MDTTTDIIELSYQAHKNNWNSRKKEIDDRLSGIRNKDSIGYRLTTRTLDVTRPFTREKCRWLTIGDYNGFEANYLMNNNQDAVASDITDTFLKEAARENLIKEYREINVEKIDFPDQSFDYVFCKEAYHHFPKAYIGLHEMIRCSKKAAIMIEPIDILARMPLLLLIKNLLDRIDPLLINKIWRNRFSFEPVGNYVYKVSEREIEKIAMGMGLSCIAFKRVNLLLDLKMDVNVVRQCPTNKAGWKKMLRRLWFKDLLGFLRIIPHNHLCCVIFRTSPEQAVLQQMKKSGYMVVRLPENPNIKKMAEMMA
jgi:SAM-dependent methyltransferase